MKKRKKTGALLLGALCIYMFLLNACTKSVPSATDLMALLMSELDHPEMQIYFDSAAEEGEGWISDDKLEALYDGHSPVSLADAYAIALCKDDRIYEIHLYHALSLSDAVQIEELMRNRLEELQSRENTVYDPESVAPGGIVWARGRWVSLLVTENNQHAKEIMKKRI